MLAPPDPGHTQAEATLRAATVSIRPESAETPHCWRIRIHETTERPRRQAHFRCHPAYSPFAGDSRRAPVTNQLSHLGRTTDHLREQFACGPEVERHVQVVRLYADAGRDHLALINAGSDVDGFFDFFTNELGPALRDIQTDER
ncbi:hypothetical protein [Kribbella sp.]|uniref:hypothetical protein n=1 Tax=Kribbella sp. TaxID=1871183 RepID=UPI002D719F95|nr:hypothetical protein [Kribbella sp.]HZX02836.1 hypothetical protein [Kribbella sp.]